MLSELGLSVARSIPVRQVIGLATGSLSLHGGVIRDAAGRIVSHLMPASAGLLSAVPGLGAIGSVVTGTQNANLERERGCSERRPIRSGLLDRDPALSGLGLSSPR